MLNGKNKNLRWQKRGQMYIAYKECKVYSVLKRFQAVIKKKNEITHKNYFKDQLKGKIIDRS